jgi:hypothetical protein
MFVKNIVPLHPEKHLHNKALRKRFVLVESLVVCFVTSVIFTIERHKEKGFTTIRYSKKYNRKP